MAEVGKTRRRGVLFRPHPRGSQKLPGGARGDWWVSYCCADGHRHREKIGPKALAQQEHARRRIKVRTEEYCPSRAAAARVTVDWVLSAVIADYKANGRSALAEVERHQERLAAHFGPERDAATLTAGDIDAYAESRRKGGAAVATVNRELSCLRRGLRLAFQEGATCIYPACRRGG
jgi:hypothetical protein